MLVHTGWWITLSIQNKLAFHYESPIPLVHYISIPHPRSRLGADSCVVWHWNHPLSNLFCASIRHYSPKLVQTDYWIQTGQPTRLPAADRHHRSSTSARFSGGRPHCVVPGQGGCDWTEVSLWAIRGHGNSICYGLILRQEFIAFTLSTYHAVQQE